MKRTYLILSALMLTACAKADDDAVRVIMETSAGEIVMDVYPDKAPVSANNFLHYVDEGLYEGATIYRTTRPDNDPMIEVIQGGLWTPANLESDDGFIPPLPPVDHETTDVTGLTHGDGVISLARLEPGTASSEFFITIGANHELDFGGDRHPDGQGFAAFGKIVSGMDVARAIQLSPTVDMEGAEQLLVSPVEIVSIKRQE